MTIKDMDNNGYDMEMRKARVKARLDAAIEEHALSGDDMPARSTGKIRVFAAALSCLAAALVLFVALNFARRPMPEDVNWTEVTTAYGEKKSVLLPDGTVIWLHNESRLLYPDRFVGRTRQVFSSGEIYAEVAKDRKHPFILSSNNVNVRVKGTTFNFRAYPKSAEAELTLVEGAVNLDFVASGIKQYVEIAPGQVVKADLENGRVTRTYMKPEEYVSWTERTVLYFNDETLENIVAELQRHFGIIVDVSDRNLLERRFYASFVNGETPMEILESLNEDGRMKISRKGDTYHIRAR